MTKCALDARPPRTRPLSGRTSPRFQRRPAGRPGVIQNMFTRKKGSSSKFCSGCSCLPSRMQVRGLPCCSVGQSCLLSTYSRPAKERTAFHEEVRKRAASLTKQISSLRKVVTVRQWVALTTPFLASYSAGDRAPSPSHSAHVTWQSPLACPPHWHMGTYGLTRDIALICTTTRDPR